MADEKEKTNNIQEKEKINSAKKLSIKEGSATSVMEGFGNRYITPYALSLGASNFQIGLISSLPGLLGNFLQLPFLYLMKKYSRKKIVIYSVFTQAFLWLPLIIIGALYFFKYINAQIATNLLIMFYSLLIIAGTIASPAWNSWMKDIVVENKGEYFGKRNKITNVVAVISMLTAGLILNYFGKEDSFRGFLIIFFIAFIGRSISGYLFTKKYEPMFKYEDNYYFSFFQFVRHMYENNFGRFVILAALVSFSTAIASPFFPVFQLKYLNFSYLYYTILILSGLVSTIIFMPFWGKFADKYGNLKSIKINGLIIPSIPILYLFSVYFHNHYSQEVVLGYLIFVEIISGFSWSGFNLSLANFIFDAVTRQRMAICIAYFNLINAIGVFIGAYLGGFILSMGDYMFGFRTIFIIFLLSGIFRLLFVIIMTPLIKEVRPVQEFHLNEKIKEKIKSAHILKYIGFNPIRNF